MTAAGDKIIHNVLVVEKNKLSFLRLSRSIRALRLSHYNDWQTKKAKESVLLPEISF